MKYIICTLLVIYMIASSCKEKVEKSIDLSGEWQFQIDPDNVLFPFGLQPEKEYTGAAWYQKNTTVPSNWQGKTVRLTLERVHWESKVWVNGEPAGMQNSLATPHIYDVSSLILPTKRLKSGQL